MSGRERKRFYLLLALHVLWGMVLWVSISKYGPGVSTDAVHIMFGGQNLSSGSGLTSYDGSFLLFWPPLYPVLLAAIHSVTGVNMLAAATLVQVLAFICLSAAVSFLFMQIFHARIGLAVAAVVLSQIGLVVVLGFAMVGSDYLHLALAMAAVAFLGRYLNSGSRVAYMALAVLSLLAALQRYIGFAVVATTVLAVILRSPGSPSQRIRNSLVLGLTAAPTALWWGITSRLYSLREPVTFAENFGWFSRSLIEWFTGPFPPEEVTPLGVAALWMGLALLAAAALLRGRLLHLHGTKGDSGGAATMATAQMYLSLLLLYGLVYAVALFGSASLTYFNKLGGRFLLPVYIPIVTMCVAAVDLLLDWAARSRSATLRKFISAAGIAALAGLVVLLVGQTYPAVNQSRLQGVTSGDNAYNNSVWHADPVLRYWNTHTPSGDYTLLSNEPDGVAFHTERPVRPAPRSQVGPYAVETIPLRAYAPRLFAEGVDVYLYWLESTTHEYYYSPDELDEIADVELLFAGENSAIYQLHSRTGS